MTNWFYKATPAKVSFEDTRHLAVNEGFLCRSAYEENGTRADNTQHVELATCFTSTSPATGRHA